MVNQIWYVVVNDLIGGWSIGNVDKPLLQHDMLNGDRMIADVLSKELAEHIVELHNNELGELEHRYDGL